MTPTDLRQQLSLVEAQLFASTELAVIAAIDESDDDGDAVRRLRDLGMSNTEAEVVLDMPLRVRTRQRRTELLHKAQQLRDLID